MGSSEWVTVLLLMEGGSGGGEGVGEGPSPECKTTVHASLNKHMLHLFTVNRYKNTLAVFVQSHDRRRRPKTGNTRMESFHIKFPPVL